jgi:hypothetical protein
LAADKAVGKIVGAGWFGGVGLIAVGMMARPAPALQAH